MIGSIQKPEEYHVRRTTTDFLFFFLSTINKLARISTQPTQSLQTSIDISGALRAMSLFLIKVDSDRPDRRDG